MSRLRHGLINRHGQNARSHRHLQQPAGEMRGMPDNAFPDKRRFPPCSSPHQTAHRFSAQGGAGNHTVIKNCFRPSADTRREWLLFRSMFIPPDAKFPCSISSFPRRDAQPTPFILVNLHVAKACLFQFRFQLDRPCRWSSLSMIFVHFSSLSVSPLLSLQMRNIPPGFSIRWISWKHCGSSGQK